MIHYGFTLEQAFTQILIAKKPVLHNQFNHMIMLRIYQIIKSGRKESFALKHFTNHTFYSKLRIFQKITTSKANTVGQAIELRSLSYTP